MTASSAARSSRLAAALFLLFTAAAAAISAIGAMRSLSAAWPLTAAAAGGAFATVVVRVRDSAPTRSQLAIVLLAAGCSGLGCWVLALEASNASTPSAGPTRVTILAPTPDFAAGEVVNPVAGTVRNLRPGEVLWPMAQTRGERRYYLMPSLCSVSGSSHWTCGPLYLGPHAFDQHRYRILIRIFDGHDVQRALDDWVGAVRAGEDVVSFMHPLGRAGAEVTVRRVGPTSGAP